jgi:hypothetical protein
LIVNFGCDDLHFIATVAHNRQENKANSDIPNQRYSSKTDYQCNYDGVMTEYAVHKATNTSSYKMAEICYGADDGVDIVINGWDCHIKTSVGKNCPINKPLEKNFTAFIGIFVRVLCQTQVEILGCISRHQYDKLKGVIQWGSNPERFNVTSDQLKPLKVLYEAGPSQYARKSTTPDEVRG